MQKHRQHCMVKDFWRTQSSHVHDAGTPRGWNAQPYSPEHHFPASKCKSMHFFFFHAQPSADLESKFDSWLAVRNTRRRSTLTWAMEHNIVFASFPPRNSGGERNPELGCSRRRVYAQASNRCAAMGPRGTRLPSANLNKGDVLTCTWPFP